MVQATTADVQPGCDHPRADGAATRAMRQKIARDKYRLSPRGKLRRKLREAGYSKAKIDRLIREQYPARANMISTGGRSMHATDH